jgi:probable HAF family extracellular repeat protein
MEIEKIYFRVASVPEPGSIALVVWGTLGLLTYTARSACRKRCVAVLALMGGAGNAWAMAQYIVTDLGTLPGENYSDARGVNNSGQVVGYGTTPSGVKHAFLYCNGSMMDLGTVAGGSSSYAAGITDTGQVDRA